MNYSSLYIFCSNFRLSVLIYGIIHPGCFHIYHFFSRPNILDQHLCCSVNKISFKNNNRSQRELFHTKKQEIRGSLVPKRHFKVLSSSIIKVWEVQGSLSKYKLSLFPFAHQCKILWANYPGLIELSTFVFQKIYTFIDIDTESSLV